MSALTNNTNSSDSDQQAAHRRPNQLYDDFLLKHTVTNYTGILYTMYNGTKSAELQQFSLIPGLPLQLQRERWSCYDRAERST